MRTGACPPERPVREARLNNAIQASALLLQCLSVWIIQEIDRFRTTSMRDALSFPPPPLLSFPASFLPVINNTIPCKISSRKHSFFSLSFFFFFFAISIARNVISEIGRCEVISICFVRVLLSSCYIIFEFLNSISLFESFKKKKKKKERYICISIKGPR